MLELLREIDYPDFTPIDRALCRQCKAECCDSTTPFTKKDIAEIKKKHRKLLRGVEAVPSVGDAFVLRRHNNDKCVFLGDDDLCRIYDVRPQICRDFGDKPWCLCAYNGLSEIPTDPKVLAHLASEAQRINAERLAAGMGIKTKANMIDPGVGNVLSDAYKESILDFRKQG